MLKKFQIFIILFFSFFLCNNVLAQEKIAFIDLNYVYINSKIGKKMSKDIETKQKKISKEFKEFQKKLDKEKENLLNQKNVLAEEEFKKKLADLENNLKKYSQVIAKKNKDLLDFKNKGKEQFANSLKSTLEKYAKENSISMILRKEQILIGKTNLDITKEILDLFNKS
jgi:outer membrane protein